tara:strand:+ start:185 stop:1609 length:1425 start_codon:yes stop_codon:yes gene_type:complete
MAVNDQFFNIGNNPNLDAADTGIDPATGKILTSAERKKIFKSRILSQQNRQKIARTSKMAFGGGALVLAGKGAIEEKRVQAEGGALVAPVNNLTKRVDALEASVANIQTSLANIRKVIIKGNEVDTKIQEELAKQQSIFLEKKQKQEAEAELEETDLEQQAGVQVEKQEKKTFSFFEGLKKAIMLLFGGFIVKKAFRLFNAWRDGNTELFKELGIDLNSALQQVTTGVYFFNKIVGNLIKLAGNFARSIGKLVTKVVTFPFKVAGRVIKSAVKKAFVGIKRAIGPGMRKAIKGFFNIGKKKVGQEVGKKVVQKSAQKIAKKGILGSIPIIGTGLDIWGAVSEGMKGNWVGAGLYTAGAITSLIPGMQGISGVLSVSAMGQSIHSDLKRDAKNEGVNMEGTDGVEINGTGSQSYENLGPTAKAPVKVNVIQAGQKQQGNGEQYASAGNSVPILNSSNKDNLYDNFSRSTYNAYLA